MLLESWGSLSLLVGKGHPKLNASEVSAILGRRLLRVRDPPTCGHEIEHTGAGRPLEPEAVVVEKTAFEQPGDGLQPDMGMRRDIHRLSEGEAHRSVGIQETPWTDRPSLTPGEEASDRETAEVSQPSGEDLKDRLGGGFADAQFDFGRRREIAHRGTSLGMMIHPPASLVGPGTGTSREARNDAFLRQ